MGFLLIVIIAVVAAVMAIAGEGETERDGSFFSLSIQVEAYRETVTAYAEAEGLEEYVNHILCIMQVETGGQGSDVMNAGDKDANTLYPKERGSITSPEYSIECGVKEFAALLTLAEVSGPGDYDNLPRLYQGYHFGRGYVSFAAGTDREYSPEQAGRYKWEVQLNDARRPDFAKLVHELYLSLSKGSGDFIWPVPGQYQHISSHFGWRIHPFSGVLRYHDGVDIAAPFGTPIYAMADGTVEYARHGHWSYGNYLKIQHGGVYASMYAHCIRLAVSAGETVAQGDVIGYVGSTGQSTGAHLHLELYVNGQPADALEYIEN